MRHLFRLFTLRDSRSRNLQEELKMLQEKLRSAEERAESLQEQVDDLRTERVRCVSFKFVRGRKGS